MLEPDITQASSDSLGASSNASAHRRRTKRQPKPEAATNNRIVWEAMPAANAAPPLEPREVLKTDLGKVYHGDSRTLMERMLPEHSVDVIVTSPPFPLVRKKDYGNEDADRYVEWFQEFARGFVRVLKPRGSLILDIGGAWKSGQPSRSMYHYELVLMLARKFKFHLAQEFFWWNPAKMPTPAEWVNIRRVRAKDAVNYVWWLSLSPYPRASNRRILLPYSPRMQELLRTNDYNRGWRPSGYVVGDKFGVDNGGAIPPNLLALANTESNNSYLRYCDDLRLRPHPARFPAALPAFFLRLLTNRNDVVLDPFAGSCVTGEVAEQMQRQWLCCEIEADYVIGARGRFLDVDDWPTVRSEPYLAYPPASSKFDDSEIPLIEDGGEHRPKTGEGATSAKQLPET